MEIFVYIETYSNKPNSTYFTHFSSSSVDPSSSLLLLLILACSKWPSHPCMLQATKRPLHVGFFKPNPFIIFFFPKLPSPPFQVLLTPLVRKSSPNPFLLFRISYGSLDLLHAISFNSFLPILMCRVSLVS